MALRSVAGLRYVARVVTSPNDEVEGSPDDLAGVLELVYEASVRRLEYLTEVKTSYHTRAGILLAAATAATAFLGGAILNESGGSFTEDRGVALAIVLYLAVGVASGAVLWPRTWFLTDDPRVMIEGYVGRTLNDTRWLVSEQHALRADSHDQALRRMRRWLQLAAWLTIVEVALWMWRIREVLSDQPTIV